MKRYYKFLQEDGTSPFQSSPWPLPIKNEDGTWTPGEWLPALEGEPVECEHGYHACRLQPGVLEWLNARMFEVEADGDWTDYDTKSATTARVRLVREVETWNDRTARLLACFRAEDVLPIYEKAYPDDPRPRTAIEVTRRYADGQATAEELHAAWATAWAASWAAAKGRYFAEFLRLTGLEVNP